MIIDGVELRPQGKPPRKPRALPPSPRADDRLLNLDIQGLGLGVAGSILNRQGVSGVFFGRDLHAAVVRRPNRVVLRLQLTGLGVGHAITELHRVTAVDNSWSGVESLGGQFLSAKVVDGLAVSVQLLLRSLFQRAALELAIFLPPREE